MIEVHHLNASRSRRITWMLEELGLPYDVVTYQRDPVTNLAPPSLKAIHPLGKAPVLRDRGKVFIESGAIIDYLLRQYGAELYVGRLGEAGAPLHPRIEGEIQNHLGWLDSELAGRDYFVGSGLTGADVQLSFVAQIAARFAGREAFPNLTAFADRIEARPAYQRAMARSGA
ncbi:MAG: glutathione S-transferase [Proteobacteria bacterium]|nr:glutathione S-transferase [Pseudomonadota bacterium]